MMTKTLVKNLGWLILVVGLWMTYFIICGAPVAAPFFYAEL